jgi:hypothetical protein
MDSQKNHTQSFIIKVWFEEIDRKGPHTFWRGRITHVPSGERRHVQDLDGIINFITPYLEQMGVILGTRWRIRREIAHWGKSMRTRMSQLFSR